MKSLEVLFSPAEFAALSALDLSMATCVVFDVLRATSSMAVALHQDARAVVPVAGIPEALAIRSQNADVLLAGEREGLRIATALTGGVEFDLGNSPREFKREVVAGKTIVMTTTNGTRALRATAHANRILVASFLNLQATADWLASEAPSRLLLVCAGTREEPAYEDALCAGALCELLWTKWCDQGCSDSALMALRLFRAEKGDLLTAISQSRNGRRLISIPDLCEDVPYCAQRDLLNTVLEMDRDGRVRPMHVAPGRRALEV
ncbi:MAG TPA: 2-phosphosulfolactate phosphatase [Terrimicrobiaceae bacterium]